MKIKEIEKMSFKKNDDKTKEKKIFLNNYYSIITDIFTNFIAQKNEIEKNSKDIKFLKNIKLTKEEYLKNETHLNNSFSINYNIFNIYKRTDEFTFNKNDYILIKSYIIEDKKSKDFIIYTFNSLNDDFMNTYSHYSNKKVTEIEFKEYKTILELAQRFIKDDFICDSIKIQDKEIIFFNNIHKSDLKK